METDIHEYINKKTGIRLKAYGTREERIGSLIQLAFIKRDALYLLTYFKAAHGSPVESCIKIGAQVPSSMELHSNPDEIVFRFYWAGIQPGAS
jgi:hypothetical protein